MSKTINWHAVTQKITEATNRDFIFSSVEPVHGGDINMSYRLTGCDAEYFVKLNRSDLAFMFESEALGLKEIAASNTIKVPDVITVGTVDDKAYIVLESIVFGRSNQASNQQLGKLLARMHKIQQPFFGWHQNNTIGSTAQQNDKHHDWVDFWSLHRLGYQLDLAASKGYGGSLQRKGDRLLELLPAFFSGYEIVPSLLHGDLWGGNAGVDQDNNPIIFDPACYYGDREADLAMTELFGGFGGDFYAAYKNEWPLDAGYSIRKIIYNLYHILNHLNLFGSGYKGQAENMMERIISEAV